MGVITERTLKRNISSINQTNGLFVDVNNINGDGSHSSAQLNTRNHIPERLIKNKDGQTVTVPSEDHTLKIPLDIYHGPYHSHS